MKGQQIHYSKAELAFIKANSTLPRKELYRLFCIEFNRNDISQNNLSALCKRNDWLTGRTGCFEKGNIPSPLARPKGPNKTSFKKGNRPHNWRPVGSTRCVDGYLEVKVAEPKTWEQKHVLVWEKENGKTPDGFCVVFIDSDKENIEPDNLELISRNENLQINRLRCFSEPKQIQPVVRTLGKLVAKIFDCQHGLDKN